MQNYQHNEPDSIDVAKSIFADLASELDDMKAAFGRIRELQNRLRAHGEPQLFQASGFVWESLLENAALASGLTFTMSDNDSVLSEKEFEGFGSSSVPFVPFTFAQEPCHV